MYVKIVQHLYRAVGVPHHDGEEVLKTVPKTSYLFETDEISYKRVVVNSHKEFDKYLKRWCDCSLLGEVPSEIKGVPFVHITVRSRQEHEVPRVFTLKRHLFIFDGIAFIMNEEGKTIDKISCLKY